MSDRPQISYQMYSSRNFPDLARQTAMLAEIGFRHVEPFGGLFADVPALQAALQVNGLDAPTAHIGLPALREDFDGAMAKLRAIGVKVAIAPAPPLPERKQDREGWQKLGRELLGYAKRATDQGFVFAWHNHNFEFARLPDGSMPLEWILGDDPLILWQCDIAWLVRGQQDPVVWIKRYASRMVSFHLKDLAEEGQNADEDGWADVGYGRFDWPALVSLMRSTPATIWTLEHDNPTDDARFARRSLATVSSW
jgi:sugar phosphate isomerase/epimerase